MTCLGNLMTCLKNLLLVSSSGVMLSTRESAASSRESADLGELDLLFGIGKICFAGAESPEQSELNSRQGRRDTARAEDSGTSQKTYLKSTDRGFPFRV